MKNKETITLEIKNYIETKLRKNRGEILSIEIKTVGDYIPNPQVYSPDFIVGGFVEFSEGDKIFVYRFENEVNNYENGRGYGTYSKSFNKVSKVKKVIEGWDKWAYTVGTLEAILDWEVKGFNKGFKTLQETINEAFLRYDEELQGLKELV